MCVGTECAQLVDKKQVFDYRLRHTDSESALGFIMSRVPPLASSSHCPSEVASLCSDLSQCVSHLRDSILDELGRYTKCFIIIIYTIIMCIIGK